MIPTLHIYYQRSWLLAATFVLMFCFPGIRKAECQVYESPEDKRPARVIIDSIGCCYHYIAEIPYMRITFRFPDGARPFDIAPAEEFVPSTRLNNYEAYRFDFTGLEGVELFNNLGINYTNTFFVLEFVSRKNKNFMLLSKNIKITDRQIKRFVKNKVFIDLFTVIDHFNIIDVMQVVEYKNSMRDTVYIEKVVHDTVYVDVGSGDALTIIKEVVDTVFVEVTRYDTVYIDKIIHDTLFMDKLSYERVYLVKDDFESIPIVEKVVFANHGDYVTDLNYILSSKFSSWIDDPYLILDFKFRDETEDMVIKKPDRELKDLPEGYIVRYVIYPENKSRIDLFPDCDFVRLHSKIALKLEDNRCWLLTRKDIKLRPHEFEDKDAKTTSVLISY